MRFSAPSKGIFGFVIGVATCSVALAQVVTDGTTGDAVTLTGPDIEIGAELGTQAGTNLFQSFEQFSIRTGESATFTGPDGIENVISRVTGGNASSIDGRLASTIPGADLWLFNPSGVVFGPNATLDLTGSFHVSTADEVRTTDGGVFSAVDPESSGFSVAAPESFGFLNADPAGIAINGSQLAVGAGETLSVVGGDVDIAGAALTVETGRLNVLAAGGPGNANVATGNLAGDTSGGITVTDSASVASIGNGGGSVRIQGGAFVVDGGSIVAVANNGATDAIGSLDVDVASLEVDNGARLTTTSSGAGKGADIQIAADGVALDGATAIFTNTTAAGDGGAVSLDVGSLTSTSGQISALSGASATGRTGDLTIVADRIELRPDGPGDNNLITTNSFGTGGSGDLDVEAGTIVLDGNDQVLGATISSIGVAPGSQGGQVTLNASRLELINGGVVAASPSGGSATEPTIDVTADDIKIAGDDQGRVITGISFIIGGSIGAGTIAVRAGSLDISDGGSIASDTNGAIGAGDIVVTADSIKISDDGTPLGAGINSDAGFVSTGDAGQLTVVADRVELTGSRARISSSTVGAGNAGSVNVTANDSLILDDNSEISTNAELTATGSAGTVAVQAGELSLLGGGEVNSITFGPGNGGSISIVAGKTRLDAQGTEDFGGISAQAAPGSTGNAGDLNLQFGEFTMSNDAQINSSSFGTGDAGDIALRADTILIEAPDPNAIALTGIVTSTSADSAGESGSIEVAADRLVLQGDAAQIAASSDGQAAAGTIAINVSDSLLLFDGSDITTDSANSGGGGITIVAGNAVIATDNGSFIRTSVADDEGDAGDITIQAPILALGDASVQAEADAGQGGDILITVDDIVLSPEALISADAGETGVNGTVQVSSPEVDLSGGLIVLDEGQIDAASLLRARCAAVKNAGESSFTAVGQGGLASTPDDHLISRYLPEGSVLAQTVDGRFVAVPAAFDRSACKGPV